MAPLHTLLLVSDPERRRALEAELREAGQVPVIAASAAEAAEALGTPGLDLLWLDLRLPSLDLPLLQRSLLPDSPAPPDSLESAERRHIALALRHTGGNRRLAARILGIARSTMLAKLRKYGLDQERL